jgi:radical SAM protein with 4Fe4S-binding SPASM domain
MSSATPTPLPRFVQIEPVGQCNLRCKMCPVAYRDERGAGGGPAFMSFDTFCSVLAQFPALSELHLQGMGEPFLHPRLLDMVRHAAARGIAVSTNTNLTAFSARRAEECVRSGLRHLYASLDAADAAIYEDIRVGSRLSRALRSLEWLTAAKQRLGTAEPKITMVAVAMRRNLEQLPALVRLAHRYGVQAMSVQRLAHDFTEDTLPAQYRPMRRFVEEETLLREGADRVQRWFAEASAEAQRLGVELRLPADCTQQTARKGRERCDWPWRGAYVAFSGEAMPCCMIATPDRMSLGNMAAQGVARVWDSEQYQAFRARLDSDDPPDICRGCAVYNGTF